MVLSSQKMKDMSRLANDFLRCLRCWVCFSPVTSRVSPRRATYFLLLRQKKVSKEKASHVRAASRCLALLAAFGALANSSPEMSTPLNRLRRFPLQGTTPAARQSRFRGVPGMGFACLARRACSLRSPRGGWVASFLYPHSSQGHGTPCPYTSPHIPHVSLLFMGNHKGCPYALTPHSSLHPVFPGVSAEPKLRHSAHSRGIHVPLHSNIDAATTRSMTACVGQRCPPSPTPFPSSYRAPPRHSVSLPPVIPAVTAEPKLRHSARSRGIHVPLYSNIDAATTRSMTACVGQHCPPSPTPFPSSYRAPPRHSVSLPPVIPAVTAEPKLRHSARSRGIHVPLYSNIDAATTRSMTACVGQRCPPSPTPFPSSYRAPPRHSVSLPPVIPAVTAEPKLRHSARSRGIHVPLHSNLDAATTRSMTACVGQRCPPSPTPFPVFPHSSTLIMGNHKGCPYALTPTTSLLTPHSSQQV